MGFEDALQAVLRRPRPNVDPGILANGQRDEALRQGQGDLLAALGISQSAQQPTVTTTEPTGQMLTPANQAAITRPRTVSSSTLSPNVPNVAPTVAPQLPEPEPPQGMAPQSNLTAALGDAPAAPTWNPINIDPKTGKPSVSPTAKGPRSEVLQKQYEAAQAWDPTHKENRFVAALKGGRDAIRLNARPGMSIGELVGTGIGGAGVGAATGVPGLYGKEIEMRKAGGDLQAALGIDKERAQINQLQMNPQLAARRVDQGQQRIDEQAQQNEAHRDRWAHMDQHQAAQEAQALYNSGGADDDPALLAEIGRRLKVSGTLGPHTQGAIETDAQGNYRVVNKRTGEAKTVTDENTGGPVGSFKGTQETNKNTRQDKAIAARTKIAQMGIDARIKLAREKPSAGMDPDEKSALVDQWKTDAKDKRAEAAKIQPKTQADLDRQRGLNKDAADLEKSARQAQMKPTRKVSAVTQSPQGGKYTEADVRTRAAKAGKDPDIAVASARKAKLIP